MKNYNLDVLGMSRRLIEEDLFTKYSIIDNATPEGQKIHDFLFARAKALAGKYIDFDKTPVTFVLSDSDQPNAFYAPAYDPENKPRRDDYETIRYIKNPLDTPVICITRGLLEMVDNLDQLDFVLGHELTHMIMRQYGIKQNSKGEEEIADLHAVDLMYDAGGDPKEALAISEKISAHMKERRAAEDKKRYRSDKEKEVGINWSEIFDVHMTDSNRRAGINASLTRLSHLIDERQPSEINKDDLKASYDDPVDAFLKQNQFEDKDTLGKLRVLIDCIDHLAAPSSAEAFFQEKLDALSDDSDSLTAQYKRKELQKRIDAGYKDFFDGTIIDKRYQQKIATLAEGVIREEEERTADPDDFFKTVTIDSGELGAYLQDKAYEHIAANGYPKAGDLNYLSASGILYSYFYALLKTYVPDRANDEEPKQDKQTQLDVAIESAAERVRAATTADSFIEAADAFDRLTGIQRDIKSLNYGAHGNADKLEDLSSLKTFGIGRLLERPRVYETLEQSQELPWNNLVEIAKTDDLAKERVVQFLAAHGTTDYRLTHDLPYVRVGYQNCYSVTEAGKSSEQRVPKYEIDYEVHRDTVDQAYDYVRKYFDAETALIDEKCAAVLSINDSDFTELGESIDTYQRNTIARRKIYDFINAFNAFPDKEEAKRRGYSLTAAMMIPADYMIKHPIPGSHREDRGFREHTRFDYEEELLAFDNPIFQAHFGERYEQELTAKKEAQQQKMFETAVTLLGNTATMWLEAESKKSELQDKVSALWDEIWASDDPAFKQTKRAEQQAIDKELELYKEKEDQLSSLLYNGLFSVFEREQSKWQLQRLKPEQKNALAELAVRDETGAFLKLFQAQQHEVFADYLGILEEQTQRAMKRDYQLSDWMQVIANKYDYKYATDKEALKAFVEERKDPESSRGEQQYAWYLHIFDSMEHLKKTPEIDVCGLAIALNKISEPSRVNPPHDIEIARAKNHTNFIKNSDIIPLATKAIDHQANYKALSFDELLETADALIAMRDRMAKVLEKRSASRKQKSQATQEESKFLFLADKNIRGVLRKAEHLALGQENSLDKITSLYRLYNGGQTWSSNDNPRQSHLYKLREEGRLEKISKLAEEHAFWPKGALEHTKAFVFAQNTFLDDKTLEDRLLNDVLEKLEALPAGKQKNECLFILLDQNMRAAFPETRDRLFAIYTGDVATKLGKDDGSEQYQNRLQTYLNALSNNKEKDWDIGRQQGQRNGLLANAMSAADKYLLMRRLSDAIVSQEQTSQMIKESCQVKLNSDDMVKSYLYGIGVDYLTEEMDRDAAMANRFIEFFNSKGEQKDCEDISAYIEVTMKDKYSDWNDRIDAVLKNTKPAQYKILFENFWSAPLEARAVVIARMLESAANTKDEEQTVAPESWETVFDIVMDKMIRPDDTSVEARYARDIMHSYIKSRSGYERELIMSAMMVANRDIGGDTGNIGKALKLFLENMGPAEIKLGQAIASHSDTPEDIKVELQELKDAADKPARWELYEWMRTENIPEAFWKDQYLGDILGSASYYTTVSLGDDKALRILRPEAREKANKGFKVIRATVDDLEAKDATSELSYKELTASVQEMVIQAANMSAIETDHEVGQQQYEFAKEVYDNVTLSSGGHNFTLKVMDWRAKGQNWIIMDRAKGPTFKKMPADTAEQQEIKRNFAKAYAVFELTNIVSGKKFDHDRHGAQLSIDPETNAVGIYDTGAMALHDPSPEEQMLLGNIIYDVLKAAFKGEDAFAAFSQTITEEIDTLRKAGKDTQYLVEVKKGLLALGDFFAVLTPEDVKDILPSIDLNNDVSEKVRQGITENMSAGDKLKFKAFTAMQTASGRSGITITRGYSSAKPDVRVDSITVTPEKRDKAGWVHDAFGKNGGKDDDMPESTSFTAECRTTPPIIKRKKTRTAPQNLSPAMLARMRTEENSYSTSSSV